jgi:hypothetical protein
MTIDDNLFEQLADVAEGRVTGADAEALLRQVAADRSLAEVHHWLVDFLATALFWPLMKWPSAIRSPATSCMRSWSRAARYRSSHTSPPSARWSR